MEIKEENYSQLRLEKLYIKNAKIQREEKCDNKKLSISVNHSISDLEENRYKIDLLLNIKNGDNTLSLEISMVGFFYCENKKMIEKNAIAIMFPYVRSYVSILTTQPDLSPIVLQPVNILSLLNIDK